MNTHPKKQHAKLLFVEQGMEAKQIATMLSISEQTISKWNKAEDWKQERTIRTSSPEKIITQLYAEVERIIKVAKDENRTLSTKEADALVKLSRSIEMMDKKINASITMAVLRNFNNFLLQTNTDLAKQIADYEMQYVQTLLDAHR